MSEKVGWAILGCGAIARTFAKEFKFVRNGKLVAVGSRSFEKARKFADEYGIEGAFGSYNELTRCENVDIIYVATPHPMHYENSIQCIQNNKAVLCEKPFTINAMQARKVVDMARSKRLFLMEAMWTRFLPATLKVKQLLNEGAIGEVQNFSADFGVNFDFDPNSNLFNPELGGGALLDIGIYPISFASMVFGSQPKKIASVVKIGSTGVDFNASISFMYKNGAVAAITTGLEAKTPISAIISGTKGWIELACPFNHSRKIILVRNDKTEIVDLDHDGIGYYFQVEHVGECMKEGKTESNLMGLDESVDIMKTMDAIRKQWGLVYPSNSKIIKLEGFNRAFYTLHKLTSTQYFVLC